MLNLEEGHLAERKRRSITTVLVALFMLLVFALYANLRWNNEAPTFEKAKQTADTSAYVRVAGEDLLSRRFWANTRPPLFPFVLRIFEADFIQVSAFQTAFSIFAWGMLAMALASAFNGILRPLAFVLILMLSLEHHIAGWNMVILTESLSISLLALILAAWFWLLQKWSWGKVILLGTFSLLWAFTRDTNGWILLMISGLVLLAVLFFGARKRYLAVAVLLATIFLLSNLSANRGNRWVFPFQNVLAQRILTDPSALAFFEKCGMPVTPELLNLAGGFANSEERAFYIDPALDSYREWLRPKGKTCYMRWLVSRPLESLRGPWEEFEWLLAFEDVSTFSPQAYEPILPWYIERVLYPQTRLLWLWALTTTATVVAVVTRAWKRNIAWVILIGLYILIYPHVFLVWHGDVPGTHRHALTVSLQFVLGFWLFGLLLLDSFLTHFRLRDSV